MKWKLSALLSYREIATKEESYVRHLGNYQERLGNYQERITFPTVAHNLASAKADSEALIMNFFPPKAGYQGPYICWTHYEIVSFQ